MAGFPEPYIIGHQVWQPSNTKDRQGNVTGSHADPVDRPVIAMYQTGSREPISPDYASRTVTNLTLLVKKPQLYTPKDHVTVAGKAFEVIADPADYRTGPWSAKYGRLLGGAVTVKRVS